MGDQTNLGNEKLKVLIPRYALPSIIAVFFVALNSAIDGAYLARLNDGSSLAVASLGLVNPILFVLTGIGQSIGMSMTAFCGIALGKKDVPKALTSIGNGITLLALSAIIAIPLLAVFGKDLIYMVGASEQTFPYAWDYFSVYLFGIIFHIGANGLNTLPNGLGMPRLRMMSIVLQALTNLALDPLLIFGLGMGMRGAALATVLSYGVSTLCLSVIIGIRAKGLGINRRHFVLKKRVAINTIKLSITPFLAVFTESLITACFVYVASTYGDEYVTLYTAFNLLLTSSTLLLLGFCQGMQPLLSYNLGAGLYDRVRRIMLYSVIIGSAYLLLLWSGVIFSPEKALRIFVQDGDLIKLGIPLLRIYFVGTLTWQFILLGQTFFVALDNWLSGMAIVFTRKLLLILPLIFLLPKSLGIAGLSWAELIGDVAGGAVAALLFLGQYRRIRSLKDQTKEA